MTRSNVIPLNRPHRLSVVLRDQSYRWRERDPDLEWICNQITRSNRSSHAISKQVSEATGGAYTVSPSTIDKWLKGQTNRPQNFTLTWVAYALGFEKKWTRI